MHSSTLRESYAKSLAPSLLSPAERTTLLWVCGALFPRLEATGGGDPALFTADAASVGVPARDAALRLTTVEGPKHLEADACIVGSGAGGGVVAAELARAGLRVIVLEQGPGDQAPHFDQREIVGTQRLYLDRATTSSRDL